MGQGFECSSSLEETERRGDI
jgi:hypothetical protein